MGRHIVLCLVFLSVFLSPGNVCALKITGAVWNTNALEYAMHPDKYPTVGSDATFVLTSDINFDSSRSLEPKNIKFDEFLNNPAWDTEKGKILGQQKMYGNNGQGNGLEGVFFSFTWSMYLTDSALPITITHDDGIYFFIVTSPGIFFSAPDQVGQVEVSKFDLKAPAGPGFYTVQLNYGAISDADPDVLIFSTPEPGSMLLLVLGLVGVGCLRRRK